MQSTHPRSLGRLGSARGSGRYLPATGALLLMACSAVAQKSASTDPIPVTPFVTVKVDPTAGRIDVSPKVSFVRWGGTMEFRVEGLTAGTLEIDYRVEGNRKGPFLKTESDPRGRIVFKPGVNKIALRYDDEIKETVVWKYDIALRDGKNADLKVIDPMTIGKGD